MRSFISSKMGNPVEYNNLGSNPGKVLVTGASGFVGGHIVRYFVSQGIQVSCLVRENSNLRFIQDLPVRFIQGDILDITSISEASSGMDSIIHAAAKVSDWGSYEDFYENNVSGTLNVLQAAVNNGIRKVVITGSVSSYGEEDFNGLKDENSPYNSHYPYFLDHWLPSGMNHYRDTKALCTQKAEEFAANHGLTVIVMEPTWVYGENEFSSGFYEYLKTVSSGVFVMPGCHSNNFPVIYAGDLARAYFLAYTSDLQGFHRFILGNPSPDKMVAVHRLFCEAAGVRKPLLLPRFVTLPLGFILELIYYVLQLKTPPALTRARAEMFYDNIGYSTTKSSTLLSFTPATPLREGVRKTVQWYRENHFLKNGHHEKK